MNKITSIAMAAVMTLLLVGTASAYSVPVELKDQATNDVELFELAQAHETEPWATYLLGDLGYRYNVRNHAQFLQRMEYQKKFKKITRNNLVNRD